MGSEIGILVLMIVQQMLLIAEPSVPTPCFILETGSYYVVQADILVDSDVSFLSTWIFNLKPSSSINWNYLFIF